MFVNTASASGPFVEELSAPGRTIVTATRNGAEQFTTLFGGYFVDALTSEAADADKNKRVSVLEAFKFAKAEVARAYEREGLLATEHALLDDNGDKEGSQDPSTGPTEEQGRQGGGGRSRSASPATTGCRRDPKLRALYLERRDLERRVEIAAAAQGQHGPGEIHGGAREAGDRLALKTREIRAAEGK